MRLLWQTGIIVYMLADIKVVSSGESVALRKILVSVSIAGVSAVK